MLARNCDLRSLASAQLFALVLDFVKQPHVLDRDRRLVGESRYQLDLLLAERPHLGTRQCQNASRDAADDLEHVGGGGLLLQGFA
jgi:hypothetical protein